MTTLPAIPRHKTAIRRNDFSRPLKCLLADGLLDPSATLFDYGCGRGEDVELLRGRGQACSGWDPVFCPDSPRTAADVVALSYVINVIEDPGERAATLRQAWALSRRLLVVAAQVQVSGRGQAQVEFGDGVLTGRGTFQKFFAQDELRAYLESELGADAVPAGLGVFYVFKDEAARQGFLANRYRRRPAAPRRRLAELRFEENRACLEALMAAVAELGRLPDPDEFPRAAEVVGRFGSLRRAFALVARVTDATEWEAARRRRTEDLLVYLALARFRKRPPLSQLPPTLRRDIRAFFGSYTTACRRADELLFRAGDAAGVDEACKRSPVGKLLPNALYVHRSALDALGPLLRVYEGCGRAFLGEVEGANLVKLHRFSGKISYLIYPDFEADPHPALLRCVKLSLRSRQLECYDYAESANPPVLHRKETFLHPEHPLYARFARLTEQEQRHGLLDDAATIGTREGWQARLARPGSSCAATGSSGRPDRMMGNGCPDGSGARGRNGAVTTELMNAWLSGGYSPAGEPLWATLRTPLGPEAHNVGVPSDSGTPGASVGPERQGGQVPSDRSPRWLPYSAACLSPHGTLCRRPGSSVPPCRTPLGTVAHNWCRHSQCQSKQVPAGEPCLPSVGTQLGRGPLRSSPPCDGLPISTAAPGRC